MQYAIKVSAIKNKHKLKVDKALVETLTILADKIRANYRPIAGENIDEIVQALIDRTLFIKFLEDKEIINGWFYKKYYQNENLTYKTLLESRNFEGINKLFSLINDIFNNALFDKPEIKDLNPDILTDIALMIGQFSWNSKEYSLFDFRFDVIPIEFISQIYEVFLEPRKRESGIYYTPKNLAQLIVNETITETGRILDPSCGSGMFLVLAFRKLLELDNNIESSDIAEKIAHRISILKKYIYGIEKEDSAKRIAIFSLYLELLKDIDPNQLKDYIKNKLDEIKPNQKLKLFYESFNGNIARDNALRKDSPHPNIKFDYIIGNPPFFGIPKKDDKFTDEINFLDNYIIEVEDTAFIANKIIGYRQISQCFMLRLKEWAATNAHFGFIFNTSNYYNEKSNNFRKFFFSQYTVNKIYELSEIKDILFLTSQEAICVTLFNNSKNENNIVDYLKIKSNYFSETFGTIIIEQDNIIRLNQNEIAENIINLRDYQIGNENDRRLVQKITKNNKLENYILPNRYYGLARGIEISGKEIIGEELSITMDEYNSLSKREKKRIIAESKEKCFISINEPNCIPYIAKNNLLPFSKHNVTKGIGVATLEKVKFRRGKKYDFYQEERILISETLSTYKTRNFIIASYFENPIIPQNDLFSLKLSDKSKYIFCEALFNSLLLNYIASFLYIKRLKGSYPKIDLSNIEEIPIPKFTNNRGLEKINQIVAKIHNEQTSYQNETFDKLNDLIFDLYNLNILERQRIIDFYIDDREVTDKDLEKYKGVLSQTLELYFADFKIKFDSGINLPLKRAIVALVFNNAVEPDLKHILRYFNNEAFKENPNNEFICFRERLYGKDIVFIIKDRKLSNWTETKAWEDGNEIKKTFGL